MVRCFVPVGFALTAAAAAGQPSASVHTRSPIAPPGVDGLALWDQSAFDPQGFAAIDQEFPDEPAYSSYLVNDVSTGGQSWNVETVTTWFTSDFGTWDDGGITWGRLHVFEKSGNLPAPGDFAPEHPVQITLVNLGSAWSVTADTSGIAELQGIRGEFWIGLTPWADFATFGQEYHLQASGPAMGAPTALRNPGGALGIGPDWQSWASVGGEGDATILLEGSIVPTPGAVAALMLAGARLGRRTRR